MYAVVKTGGKQYRVQEGDYLNVEKLNAEVNSTVELTDVLAVSKADGELVVGKPVVEGAKIIVFKYKPKKDYRRKQGHRQPYTRLLIEKIEA